MSNMQDMVKYILFIFCPDIRAKSYGKQLISAVIEQMHVLGYKSIFLRVLEDKLEQEDFMKK